MDKLTAPIDRVLRDDVDPHALEKTWQAIARRRAAGGGRSRSARRLVRRAAIGLFFTAAGVVGVWAYGSYVASLSSVSSVSTSPAIDRRDEPLRLAGGGEVVSIDAQIERKSAVFADGSRVTLSPGSRLDPLANDGRTFAVVLERGTAVFAVQPGGPRRWSIDAGLATVEVIGTELTILRAPDHVRVEVAHGTVLVRGERVRDQEQTLTAGGWLEVWAAESHDAGVPSAERARQQPAPQVGPDRGAKPAPSPHDAWQPLARTGAYAVAFEALGTGGVALETEQAEDIETLLALADVARLSGHPAEAVAPLERILSRHAGDRRASLAAFTLGKLELDTLGRPSAAARAFERCLSLGAPRGLEEDLQARLVEARGRSGDRAGARAAAVRYRKDFPQGRHLDALEQWTDSD